MTDHTCGLLQLASCLLSIEEPRSPRWLAHKAILTLEAVRIGDLSVHYPHIPRFDRFRPWLSVMPVKPHPPNPSPPSWLPVPCCVGDSSNSCGLSQHAIAISWRRRCQGENCICSFQSIELNARCILGEWSLGRSSAHVSHPNLRILWCASYVKVAKLRGAHGKVVGGCLLSDFTDSLLP